MTHISTGQFEGPYDLLLSLVAEKKLEITEVALADVTEQFLLYLDKLEETNPEELADFLVVASKLLFLKSKSLLPLYGAVEEEDGPSLEDQLRLYRAFVAVSKKLGERWNELTHGSFRIEPPRKAEGFVPPENVSTTSLHDSMIALLRRTAPPKALPKTTIDTAVSLKKKLDDVRALLKQKKSFLFSDVITNAQNKTEQIVSFLALLELVKGRTISLSQDEAFGDIMIARV